LYGFKSLKMVFPKAIILYITVFYHYIKILINISKLS
jgi:hypothetical protein